VTGSPRKDRAAVTGPRALVAVVVVALAGGAVGIGLGLRGHARPVVEAAGTAEAATPAAGSTSIPMPIKPPATFANALDGWTFNSTGLWATTDGGADWHYQPIIGPVPGWPPFS
jgi:hypothetical protein